MIISTWSDLLYAALRKAGVTLAPGRGPSPPQLKDASDDGNRMIGGWNCSALSIFTRAILLFDLVAGKKTYTIGKDPTTVPKADFDVDRPQEIERANFVLSTSTPVIRRPIRILTDQEWSSVSIQDLPGMFPVGLYNDGAYPFSKLSLWGQPDGGYQLEMYCWQAVPTFERLDDKVLLPPGYEDAIVMGLTPRLAQQFGKPVTPLMLQNASKAKAAIEGRNTTVPRMRSGVPAVGRPGGGYSRTSYLLPPSLR